MNAEKNPSPAVSWIPSNVLSRHVPLEPPTNQGGIFLCILPYLNISDFSWWLKVYLLYYPTRDLIILRYSSFLTSCSRVPNCEWMPVCLMHSIKTRVFNHLTRVFKFVIVMGLLACTQALTRAACIANTLWVLTARYVFTRVRCVQYSSSSNSSVPVRIGNHTSKVGRLYC